MNVTSSNTTLTFPAPSLPDGVHSVTVGVTVFAVNQFGVGPPSDPRNVTITGTVTHCMLVLPTIYLLDLFSCHT